MRYYNQALHPLLLFLLLLTGILLIRHIGNEVILREQAPSVPNAPDSSPAAEAPSAKIAEEPLPAALSKDPGPSDNSPERDLPGIVETDRGRFLSTEPILFNSGDSNLRASAFPVLDRLAKFLVERPEIKLEIVGHTDDLGPESANLMVSAERAAAVLAYLSSKGVDTARLKSKGMGSRDPIESNDTRLGKQANRRIEFLVVKNASEN
jgi:outer membrane protein OmpA-like peptidoglycan-associated protein